MKAEDCPLGFMKIVAFVASLVKTSVNIEMSVRFGQVF